MDETKKNIDESWKQAVEKEKENLKGKGEFVPPEPDFNFFITTLAVQASVDLGVAPHPVTKKVEENLPQAKFLIDTLSILKEKTRNNLTEEENKHLENVLYELRMSYLSQVNSKNHSKNPGK
ncbi:MAG: DUF1844 domain-containing protein [Candidatus Omnitrophota bacterium]|nr:MAG: DUF1844 domain-containing protein [Candidatus Omnitrophota bacterium]